MISHDILQQKPYTSTFTDNGYIPEC